MLDYCDKQTNLLAAGCTSGQVDLTSRFRHLLPLLPRCAGGTTGQGGGSQRGLLTSSSLTETWSGDNIILLHRLIRSLLKVYTMKWVGKTGHEFFTGSQDGYVKWWDIR